MADQKSQEPCRGCSEDFYNHGGNSTTGECWLLKDAKLVTRYRIGWWTAPTQPGAFTKVKTYACHCETGENAFSETLPDCAVEVNTD